MERSEVPRARVPAGDGILVVDKPAGMSSHDVVAKLRRLAATKKVGHGGTLDPAATGVLVVAVGKATRLLRFLLGGGKSYQARVRLGVGTVTDDAQGEVTSSPGAPNISAGALEAALAKWRGSVTQVPCAVSACKVDGERAYSRVRQGQEVQLAARPIHIDLLAASDLRSHILDSGLAVTDFTLTVDCSAGTYVRAIARDIGADLGVGGHLLELRRTRSGPFSLEQARTLDQLSQEIHLDNEAATPGGLVIEDLAAAACRILPSIQLDALQTSLVATGRPPGRLRDFTLQYPTEIPPLGAIAARDPAGRLAAVLEPSEGPGLGEAPDQDCLLQPKMVFLP